MFEVELSEDELLRVMRNGLFSYSTSPDMESNQEAALTRQVARRLEGLTFLSGDQLGSLYVSIITEEEGITPSDRLLLLQNAPNIIRGIFSALIRALRYRVRLEESARLDHHLRLVQSEAEAVEAIIAATA